METRRMSTPPRTAVRRLSIGRLISVTGGAAAYTALSLQRLSKNAHAGVFILGTLSFGFTVWAVYGAGEIAVFWGFILLLLGIPVYVLMKTRQNPPSHE